MIDIIDKLLEADYLKLLISVGAAWVGLIVALDSIMAIRKKTIKKFDIWFKDLSLAVISLAAIIAMYIRLKSDFNVYVIIYLSVIAIPVAIILFILSRVSKRGKLIESK